MISKGLRKKMIKAKNESKLRKYIRRNMLYLVPVIVVGVLSSSLVAVNVQALSRLGLEEVKPTELTLLATHFQEAEQESIVEQLKQNSDPDCTVALDTVTCSVKGYSSSGKTSTGTLPQEGRTIAVDPRVIPLGSTVVINGISYKAEDTLSDLRGHEVLVYSEDGTLDGTNIPEGKLVDLIYYMN